MTTYKINKTFIGESDKAFLTWNSKGESGRINFGEDGAYFAYINDTETEIPSYYELVGEFENEIVLSSDNDRTVSTFKASKINIFRSGSFGCVVQLVDPKSWSVAGFNTDKGEYVRIIGKDFKKEC